MEREKILKEVSQVLGYKRVGSVVHDRLKGHLRAAIGRGIVESDGVLVSPSTRTIDDYDRDSLIETLTSVMSKGKLYEREDLIRAAAEHLGFSRVNDNVRTAMKSAINAGIRS